MKGYQKILKAVGLWSEPPEPSQEVGIYNPLEIKINSTVRIDAIDFRGILFSVKNINEYSLSVGDSQHKMVDFLLSSKDKDKDVRLRIVPDQDSKGSLNYRSLVLSLYDELEYNEGLHDSVKDDSKQFNIDDDDDPNNILHEEFWRVNDVGISYTSSVKSLADENKDGKVTSSEVSNSQIEFWDFSRMTDIEGVEVEEFVFVEMNKSNGWFQIWRGHEVLAEKISAF